MSSEEMISLSGETKDAPDVVWMVPDLPFFRKSTIPLHDNYRNKHAVPELQRRPANRPAV